MVESIPTGSPMLDDLITALESGNISEYELDASIPDGFIESNDMDYVRCSITCISYRATLLCKKSKSEVTRASTYPKVANNGYVPVNL